MPTKQPNLIIKILSNVEEWVYEATTKERRKTYRRAISKYKDRQVERLYSLLKSWDTKLEARKPKQPYQRPTHNLFCDCRKCVPSVKTYHRKLRNS